MLNPLALNMMAFDLGASSGKMFLGSFDGERLEIREIRRFDNGVIPVKTDLFWDVLEIYKQLKLSISECINTVGQVKSIGIDSFSNDFGLLDKQGHFINQVFSYRDGRTQRNAEKIYKIMSKERIHLLSGNQNALFPTLMQLASMRLEAQSYLLDGSGQLLFLPDLFNYFLTGEIGSEYTISTVSQLFDYDQRDWNQEILTAFDIPIHLFAPILAPGTVLGPINEISLDEAQMVNVVAVCEHDTASAFLSAPFGDQSIIISSGTWSLVGVETIHHIINDYTYKHNIANEGGFPGHHRLLKNVMGMWLIQECINDYFEDGHEYSVTSLLEMSRYEKPFRCMINPNHIRFFAPGDMLRKIKEYCAETGQPCPNTPGQITRCILESLAFQYRRVIEELESVTSSHYEKINIVGGGSHNSLLNQFVANATGRTVIAGPSEATALGNLLVQMITEKEIASVSEGRQIIRNSFPLERFEPETEEGWNHQYKSYITLVNNEES